MSVRSQRTFWICIAVSLALHAIVFSELTGMISRPEPASTELTAELEPISPSPPPVIKPPPPKPAPSPRTTAPAPKPAAPAAPESPMPAVVPGVAELPPQEEAERPGAAAEPMASAETQPELPDEPAQAPSTPPDVPVAADDPPADVKLPQAGRITYEVFYGTEKFSVGRSVQTWSIDKTSYRLTSFSETTGLVGLFRPYLYSYVSEGRVEAGRLRPERFSARRGREGEREATASFDWEAHRLTFGASPSPRTVPLQAGTHDFLSFIYQLAQTALTPGRIQLLITTGTKLNRYVLEVGAEEDVDLPLGNV
ncbi:MAG: DUF3108 domain-containing protein, partial [Betaproteobacteria bacterium]